MDGSRLTEEILTLTLKMIYLISGEECVVVKKISGELVTASSIDKSGGWSRSQSPIMEPLLHPLVPERYNEQKILDLTNKMIELLTGEVPIRCQDVTVHFSMEEWEYIDGHKERYKDVMMEDHQQPTSPIGSNKRNSPEICPSPLYSQGCVQEEPTTTQDHQDEQLNVKAIPEQNETYWTGNQHCAEEDSFKNVNAADGPKPLTSSEEHLHFFPHYETKDCTIEKPCISDCSPVPHIVEQKQPSDPFHNPHSVDKSLKIFTCYKCGNCFSTNDQFRDHLQIHLEEKPYLCSLCKKCFSTKEAFIKHQQIHASVDAFKCLECGRCFSQKSHLSKHYRCHTGEKAFPCLECGKCFTQKSHLVNHQRLHTGKNIFLCPHCSKPFTLRSHFENHLRIHTGEKPFSCVECGKCFSQKSILINHQRIHSGVKPFSCPECGKCFTRKSSVFEHQVIHKGERPFPCSVCGKCFNHKSTLVNHQRSHTGIKPFECSECGKCFTRKSGLSEHWTIHTGEKQFSCHVCSKLFATRSRFLKHQEVHLGENPFMCLILSFLLKTVRMDTDGHRTNDKILNLTLEIICLLTGESCTVVKKKSGEKVTPNSHHFVSGGWSPITDPPPYSLLLKKYNDQKILDITNKMIELLTGEVPMRCQDVTVHFSLEEWEYLEGHMDLYKDVMMEDHQSVISKDGSSKVDLPERCPSPLDSQDCLQQNNSVPLDHQVDLAEDSLEEDHDVPQEEQVDAMTMTENVVHVKVEVIDESEEEEMYLKLGQIKEEEIPVDIDPDFKMEDNDFQDFAEENSSALNMFPVFPVSSNAWEHSLDTLYAETPNEDYIERKVYPCLDCGKCYYKKGSLLIHQRIHTGEKLHTCKHCGRNFVYKANLIEHERLHAGEKPFSCSDCGKCFKQKSHYFKHRRSHTVVKKPFSCSVCGKRFKDRWTLDRHERIHTGEKPFSCSECGKSFTQKYSFLEHQKIHTGEKPFPCSKCGLRFTRKSKLARHERVHTGEKPFICTECGKCFALKTTLGKHQRVHTGEKPFPCSECGKCFTQKYDVVEHQKIHTGEKPYSCTKCGKGFIRKSKLIQHERIHTGEKPFSCTECGKCFTQKPGLVQHQKIHIK
ncbi:uncharacterized protein ACNLHF_021152 [Anomaloglossus baeobatrachus]|uniref:uncharacterized protein LOC142312737 n=1 Tax=Anomaloglossus baeobatrachus TaxID=238106 RepID=UPI003F501A81